MVSIYAHEPRVQIPKPQIQTTKQGLPETGFIFIKKHMLALAGWFKARLFSWNTAIPRVCFDCLSFRTTSSRNASAVCSPAGAVSEARSPSHSPRHLRPLSDRRSRCPRSLTAPRNVASAQTARPRFRCRHSGHPGPPASGA